MTSALILFVAVQVTFLADALRLKKDAEHLLQTDAESDKKNAMLMVCFDKPDNTKQRHGTGGCFWNIASFLSVSPNSDVLVLTPNAKWAPSDVQQFAEKDSRVKIVESTSHTLVDSGVGQASDSFSNGLRQIWVANALEQHKDEYQLVAVADGADIVWQQDPFDLMKENQKADAIFFGDRGDDHGEGRAYFEKRCKAIGGKYNEKELLQKVHSQFFDEEERYHVYANGGMMMGKLAAVLELQKQMVQISADSGFFRSDQAQMNFARYFYAEKHGKESVVAYADYVRSATMGHVHKFNIFTKEGLFANNKHQPLTFLHQYDKSMFYFKQVGQIISKITQPLLDEKKLNLKW